MSSCTNYVTVSLLTFAIFDIVEIRDNGYEGRHGDNKIHDVEEASQVRASMEEHPQSRHLQSLLYMYIRCIHADMICIYSTS